MLKLKLTWPVVFMLLLAVFVWLVRASEKAAPKPDRTFARPTPYRANGHSAAFVINMDDGYPFDAAGGRDDFDAETERLDHEAAEAARATHSARPTYTMPKGAWQK